jgi:hypothetical protein
LGEAEARDANANSPDDGTTISTGASRLAQTQPARAVFVALIGLTVASVALRCLLAAHVHGPFFFLDELGYEQMARSFAHTGHFSIFGKSGLAYSPLYPVVLSPIYRFTSSPHVAYEWVKVANAVLMSLSVFPVYAIARFVLSRRESLAVAALALVLPLMAYSSLELSENLAYPLFLVAVWRLLCALRDPRPRNDALLLGAIVLASSARLQTVVLVPVALTAILLVAVQKAGTNEGVGAFRGMLYRHRLLFATVGVGLVAVVIRTIQDGGAIPLAGRYAVVGHARPPLLDVAKTTLQHLAALDLAVAVIPFACALAAGYALARSGFRSPAFVWAAVATATTFWLLLEVGFDAAAFDKTSRLPSGQLTGDLHRIHERYLIYIVPFFLVALVAMTGRGRPRVPARVHVVVAAIAALLPALIPFARDINYTSVVESPSFQVLGTVRSGVVVPITHPTITALAFSFILAGIYLLAFLDRRPPLALVVSVLGFAAISFFAIARMTSAASGSTGQLPGHLAWVDRARKANVALVSGVGSSKVAALETAFNNYSISRLYYLCRPSFESDYGERPLTLGKGGQLRIGTSELRARYAVVPTSFAVRGRVVARDPKGGFELVAPANRVVVVPPPNRKRVNCNS